MKKSLLIILLFLIVANFSENKSNAENLYFESGKKLYDNKKFKDSKFLFEKDIVFNPKSEKSYLYLSKIFKKEGRDNLQENNLNTVLLLNPKNEEAIFLLALLSIKKSNFSKTKELIASINLICKDMCNAGKELQEKLENSQKK